MATQRTIPRWRTHAAWIAATIAAAAAGAVLWSADGRTLDVVHPTRGPAVRAVYATGTVAAGITIRIAPRIAARLAELNADEGQQVRAGQVLARLDDRDLRSSVAELRAKARYAESQLLRQQELAQSGFSTRDRLEQARAEHDAAQAALRRSLELASQMSLVAPSNGIVIRRDGEVGDFIAVNQTVFFLAQAGAPPHVEAEVDEEDIPLVAAGQRVLIRADAFPGQVFEGKVDKVTPKGDPVTRSYRVRIELPATTPLKIGMTAESNIVVAEKPDAILIPAGAVIDGAVFVVREGRLARRDVKLGTRGAERVEVLSGLTASDSVVLRPDKSLKPGARVQAAQSDAGAAHTAAGQTPRAKDGG